eukprot:gb/GECG01014812.1/.p1 GENE.gb/GECG01014812.1/~~gb/GECG01014812.1/.p1  ORF type:complete len:542 (+),score=55.96 gb/GECG01014812.1/:1-1626(+)
MVSQTRPGQRNYPKGPSRGEQHIVFLGSIMAMCFSIGSATQCRVEDKNVTAYAGETCYLDTKTVSALNAVNVQEGGRLIFTGPVGESTSFSLSEAAVSGVIETQGLSSVSFKFEAVELNLVHFHQESRTTTATSKGIKITGRVNGTVDVILKAESSLTLAPKSHAQLRALLVSGSGRVIHGANSETILTHTLQYEESATSIINEKSELKAHYLKLSEGATIDGKGRGFPSCSGPGSPNTNSHRGASYGGLGSPEDVETFVKKENGMLAYGDVFLPSEMGSGGCAHGRDDNYGGGKGGAYLHLVVSEESEINGTIDLSGGDASSGRRDRNGPGGGSGGALLFRTGHLKDSFGRIKVNGGMGGRVKSHSHDGLGGGGGRVAMYCDSVFDDHGLDVFTVEAFGGISYTSSPEDPTSYTHSGPGTFYRECRKNVSSHLNVDGGSVSDNTPVAVFVGYSKSRSIKTVSVRGAVLCVIPGVGGSSETIAHFESIAGNGNGKFYFADKVVACNTWCLGRGFFSRGSKGHAASVTKRKKAITLCVNVLY